MTDGARLVFHRRDAAFDGDGELLTTSGFDVDFDGRAFPVDSVAAGTPGLFHSRVAGISRHRNELHHAEIAPMTRLVIAPEPANPADTHALRVGLAKGRSVALLGYVPAPVAAAVADAWDGAGIGIAAVSRVVRRLDGTVAGLQIVGCPGRSLAVTLVDDDETPPPTPKENTMADTKQQKGVSLPHAEYLGGVAQLGRKRIGNLWVTPTEVGIGTLKPKAAVIPVADIASVAVGGEQVAKRRVGAELAFGVLGGLGARGGKDRADVAVYLRSGDVAYYRVDKKSAAEVRAKIGPVLRAAGVALSDSETAGPAPAPAAAGNVADELAKLAGLRDAGVLTAGEFDAQKAKLLS
jgi:hypothetical protein